tara:strand:+ start:2779 stop:3633 length:855 start_codon:yes stop_codon:yes gene_type:complete
MEKYIILFKCPDRRGIIKRITKILFEFNLNIVSMEEHVDNKTNYFFSRIAINSKKDLIDNVEFQKKILTLEKKYNGWCATKKQNKKVNCAIFVTKEQLPLYDLLIKNETNELNCNIKLVVSNHKTLKSVASKFNIPYFYFPLNSKNKHNIEPEIIELMRNNKIELIILARYMQILSPDFVKKFNENIINIHHGFLPAFKGGRPYKQAWERGVKIIGATSHYVTNDLDEGPIISQDIIPINHRFSEKNMILAGKDIERRVLINAVQAHTENRVIIYEGRTIVFNR